MLSHGLRMMSSEASHTANGVVTMPQTFHVGYRSPLVTAVAWLLMAMGLAGLALLGFRLGTAASLLGNDNLLALAALVPASLLAITSGQALLRRFEWGRRLAVGLLLSLMLALPVVPLLAGSGLALAALCLICSAALIGPLRAIVAKAVRHEFG